MRSPGMLCSPDKGIPQKAFVEAKAFLQNLGTIGILNSDGLICPPHRPKEIHTLDTIEKHINTKAMTTAQTCLHTTLTYTHWIPQ